MMIRSNFVNMEVILKRMSVIVDEISSVNNYK